VTLHTRQLHAVPISRSNQWTARADTQYTMHTLWNKPPFQGPFTTRQMKCSCCAARNCHNCTHCQRGMVSAARRQHLGSEAVLHSSYRQHPLTARSGNLSHTLVSRIARPRVHKPLLETSFVLQLEMPQPAAHIACW
jgi:hypothetical protein